jgi:pimeloyl-ACP methyl ester carboxylesterase
MWQHQVAPLSAHFSIIFWDMRGHGQSEYRSSQAAYSEVHTISDVPAILDAVCTSKSQKAIVGGLGLGGYRSLAFYRVHPERVKALLIIDTGLGFKNKEARKGWNDNAKRAAETLEAKGLAALEGLSRERTMSTHRDARGLALAARGVLVQRHSKMIDSLVSIQVPALVVVGSEYRPFLAASEYMAKKMPNGEKVIVPDAGHAVNIDQPEGFLKALGPFLDKA